MTHPFLSQKLECAGLDDSSSYASRCEICEKFFFKNEIKPFTLKNKQGEFDTFWMCGRCIGRNHDKIAQNIAAQHGLDVEVARKLNVLVAYTKRCAYQSKGRKLHFLSVQDLVDVWVRQNGRCAMSGVPFDVHGDYLTLPSVDRVDSDGHYSADNIQLVTQAVNIGKSTLSNDAFIAMCIGVANTNHPRPQ
jgi:hypothetical protein